ncbi:MAG: signal peptidase II [Defluviitaleaceae bacterium]|nr:signal peptidase II [Defluviitaleaceae bacterium]MCL2203778.1 signal peptidase II [Defluviitaleaceae bacterium]MCL2239247.1 signal peptidase II [Defluviitaleaceae bacterium]
MNKTRAHEDKKSGLPRKFFSWWPFLFFSAILIALDQWLKIWSSANLAGQPRRAVVDGVLGLTYFHNRGAAFGLLSDREWGRWVITVLVIVLLAGVAWYYGRLPTERKLWWVRAPLILIFAGGLGNLIDRFRLGYVVDMLEFLFVNFAIFNLADVFVTVGAFSMVLVVMLMGKKAPWPFGG